MLIKCCISILNNRCGIRLSPIKAIYSNFGLYEYYKGMHSHENKDENNQMHQSITSNALMKR